MINKDCSNCFYFNKESNIGLQCCNTDVCLNQSEWLPEYSCQGGVKMFGDNEFKSCTTCKHYCPADDFATCSSKRFCQNFQYWEEEPEEQSAEPETSCHRCINMGKAFDSTSNDTPCYTCDGYTNFEQDAKQVVFQTQVGGSHYKNQNAPAGFPDPAEFCMVHDLGGAETAVIKYTFRHRLKNGLEDIKKAQQYLKFIAAVRYNAVI